MVAPLCDDWGLRRSCAWVSPNPPYRGRDLGCAEMDVDTGSVRDRPDLCQRDVEPYETGYAPGSTRASPRRRAHLSMPGSETATR